MCHDVHVDRPIHSLAVDVPLLLRKVSLALLSDRYLICHLFCNFRSQASSTHSAQTNLSQKISFTRFSFTIFICAEWGRITIQGLHMQ